METVMDGDGRCDDNTTATTVMEGATATQRRWNVTMTTMDGVTVTETATGTVTAMAMAMAMVTATAIATATATAMDGKRVKAMEDATATRQQ